MVSKPLMNHPLLARTHWLHSPGTESLLIAPPSLCQFPLQAKIPQPGICSSMSIRMLSVIINRNPVLTDLNPKGIFGSQNRESRSNRLPKALSSSGPGMLPRPWLLSVSLSSSASPPPCKTDSSAAATVATPASQGDVFFFLTSRKKERKRIRGRKRKRSHMSAPRVQQDSEGSRQLGNLGLHPHLRAHHSRQGGVKTFRAH